MPLGYILYFIYEAGITNIGVAIIIFTFIVKLAMLPLSIKQQKNSAKSAIFAPKVREIQEKYRNNQEKQQEELQKLQAQGYNPMSGCGSLVLTFLLLFGVLDVVYKPMTHIIHTQKTEVEELIEEGYTIKLASLLVDEHNNVSELKGDALEKHNAIVRDAAKLLDYYNANLPEGAEAADATVWDKLTDKTLDVVDGAIEAALLNEYEIVKANNKDTGKELLLTETDLFAITSYERTDAAGNKISSEKDELKAITDADETKAYREEHLFDDATLSLFKNLQTQLGYYKIDKNGEIKFTPSSALQRELYVIDTFGTEKEYADGSVVSYKQFFTSANDPDRITELYDNLDFLGIKLTQIPKDHIGFPMLFIPIVAFILSIIQAYISNRSMEKNNPGAMGGGMKATMYIMPIFSIVFVFAVPAGAGFYWTISYVFGIAQTIILNTLYSPIKLRAQAEAEYKERMKALETQQKRRNTDYDNSVSEYKGEKLTQKEINRRKLAEARRQDALKYGEEYNDDEDDI